MRNRKLVVGFVCMDWLTALCSWMLFFYVRKVFVENVDFEVGAAFYLGISTIPLLWILIYYLQGTYHDIKRLYRFKLFHLSIKATFIGSIFIFFTLLLDDAINGYTEYYKLMLLLISIHFFSSFIPRLIFITLLVKRIHSGKFAFKTLLIGGNQKAFTIYNEIISLPKGSNQFIGFVNINDIEPELEAKIPCLGSVKDLEKILAQHAIEDVIIALEGSEHDLLLPIIQRLGDNYVIKILPDMSDILSVSARMTNIFGALLIEVTSESMPLWQQLIKRFLDVFISIISIIILLPFYIAFAIGVKLSSDGPIFFLQERVGKDGKLFKIIKYRTMHVDAEKNGPKLSSSNDPRITRFGRFMRKFRLDEFPQFVNVLKGDMSLVGPRPERQFYIDQILEIEPQFLQLTKVRPGITSWGQVKYGYAENVEQMLQRMKYDLLYMKNRTLALDFKIMLYTIMIVIKAKGK